MILKKPLVIGHRGARGLLPENSLQGFAKAVALGAGGIEMDLFISAEGKVVVTHDPFISPKICRRTDGKNLTEEESKNLIIHYLPYTQIHSFDCGSKPHPGFPQQQNFGTHIPLLSEVLENTGLQTIDGKPLLFVLELKSDPKTDGVYHPPPHVFVEKVLEEIYTKGHHKQSLIISFDRRTLIETKKQNSKIQVGYLFEHENFRKDLDKIERMPEFLCPHFTLLDTEFLKFAEERKTGVIPWTVNEKADLEKTMALPVDAIITDYPDLLLSLIKEKK